MELEMKSASSPEASAEVRITSGKRRPMIKRGESRGGVMGAAKQYRHLRDLTDGNARFALEKYRRIRVPLSWYLHADACPCPWIL